jgi:putative hemolysin
LKKPSWFITTTLIGNNVTLVIYGIFMAFLLEPPLSRMFGGLPESELVVFVAQTVIATLIVLVTAEFLPRACFLFIPTR